METYVVSVERVDEYINAPNEVSKYNIIICKYSFYFVVVVNEIIILFITLEGEEVHGYLGHVFCITRLHGTFLIINLLVHGQHMDRCHSSSTPHVTEKALILY